MQIVIDIDEDYVEIINKNGASNYTEEVIKNSTPLPTEKLHKLYLEASVAANTDEDDAFALGELSMIKKVYEILGKEEK